MCTIIQGGESVKYVIRKQHYPIIESTKIVFKVLAGNKEIHDGQLEQLLYYFRKVKAYSDIATDEKEMSSFRNDITQFLKHLKEEEKNMLYVQLTDFVNTFHYYYRRCVK